MQCLGIRAADDGGERFLANVRFACEAHDLKTVCIVPVGSVEDAKGCAQLLGKALSEEGAPFKLYANRLPQELPEGTVAIAACQPLASGMEAAYESRRADAVVVAARQWDDSLRTLETTVAELRLAKAKLVGAAFLK